MDRVTFVVLLVSLLDVTFGSSPSVQEPTLEVPDSSCGDVHKVSSQADMKKDLLNQYYSIGYLSLDQVAQDVAPAPGSCGLQYGSMINSVGNRVNATSASIQASVLVGPSSCAGFGLCADIFDTPSATGWPMSFLSYVAIPTNLRDTCPTALSFSTSCSKCVALKTVHDYLKWILTSPNAASILTSASFAQVPSYVVARIMSEILPNIKCSGADGNVTAIVDWPASTQAWSIIGGGTSVQSKVQVLLSNAFNIETSVSVSFLTYNPSVKQLNTGAINFEIRDFVFDTSDPVVIDQGHVMIPIMAGGIVPVYHLEKRTPLVFSRTLLSALFLGRTTSWNDDSLVSLNSAASSALPAQVPVRVVRADTTVRDGVPKVFAQSIFAFSSVALSSYTGPNPSSGPDHHIWPIQSAPFSNGAHCSGSKKCSLQICESGSFFDVDKNKCQQCPLGTFAIESGSLTCEQCPPGTFSNVLGAKGCTKCNDVSYQPESGAHECFSCPDNTRRYGVPTRNQSHDPNFASYTFGAHLGECMCVVGFWAPQTVNNSELGGVECLPCPDGASCQGFTDGVQTIPKTIANFWGDPQNPKSFFECEVEHCLPNYECAVGLTGRFCAQPAPGYYTVGGFVYECKPQINKMLIFFTILEILAWIVMVNFACSQYHSLSVDMIMLQTSGYIAKLNLRWNPDLDVIRVAADFFNFEIGFVGHQCESHDDWTDYNLFFWQISFPFMAVIVCSIWWLVKNAVKKVTNSHDLSWIFGERDLKVVKVIKNKASLSSIFHTCENFRDYVWIKSLMFFLTWYPVLVFSIFSIFTCQADAYGVEYLVHMPEIVCWEQSHWTMIYVACVYIPLVIVGIPIILGRRLYWGVTADLLNRCAFMESYGWIYSKYKTDFAWWEMVVLLRRAIICIIAAFVTVPMVSACMIIFVLNLFLCAQLVFSPQMRAEIRFLEIGAMFCCMIQAVAGVLLYPSLDASNECVGSTYLEELGSVCDSNNEYKRIVNILVLLTFSLNLLASLVLFGWKLYRNLISDAAVKQMHKLLDIPYDYYDIHLSNIIDGAYLASIIRDQNLISSEEFKERYLDLNSTIPYFIMFNHDQSGHYSQNEFAKTLNNLLQNFPGLLDWLAQSDRKLVAGFHEFVKDYSAYAREHHNVTFGEIILPAHKADILMWLMTCNDKNITTFCKLLLGVSSASGMNYFLRPGKVRDQLLSQRKTNTVLGLKKKGEDVQSEEIYSAGSGLLELIKIGNANLAAEAEQCASVCPEQ